MTTPLHRPPNLVDPASIYCSNWSKLRAVAWRRSRSSDVDWHFFIEDAVVALWMNGKLYRTREILLCMTREIFLKGLIHEHVRLPSIWLLGSYGSCAPAELVSTNPAFVKSPAKLQAILQFILCHNRAALPTALGVQSGYL
jgi:hypothetical protein